MSHGFTIPNEVDVFYTDTAGVYQSDITILQMGLSQEAGWIEGGDLDMYGATPYLSTNDGSFIIGGEIYSHTATALPTVTPDATDPMWVLVEVDTAGDLQMNYGVAAPSPLPPDPSGDRVVTAAIYLLPNDTNEDLFDSFGGFNNRVIDKRVIVAVPETVDITDLPTGTRPDGTELVPVSQSGNPVQVTVEDFIAGPCDVASGPRGRRYRTWEDFEGLTAASVTDQTYYGSQKSVLLCNPSAATTGAGAQASVTELLAGHSVYGVGSLTTGASATGRASVTGLHAYYVFDQADTLRFLARVRIPTVSTTGVQQFIVRAGITTENTGITPTGGGFYVEANTATNWQCYNDDDTTRTPGDSGIAVSNAAYVNIGIHYDGATCHFWMSTGTNPMTKVITQATNRPDPGQTGLGPTVAIVKSVGTTARTLNIDGWGCDLPINRGLSFRL